MSEAWADSVLAYALFCEEGAGPYDRIYVDRIVPASRDGDCLTCDLTVERGSLIRAFGARVGNRLIRGRCCNSCCQAMAELASARPAPSIPEREI